MKKAIAATLSVVLLLGLCMPVSAGSARVPVDYDAMTDNELLALVLELIGVLNGRGHSYSLTEGRVGGTTEKEVNGNPQPSEGAIAFGRWEQDGNEANGPEPLYWRILYEEGGGYYAVSDFVIAVQPFGGGLANWERSSLRTWLNGEFYRNAFSDAEKANIILRKQLNIGTPAWVASDDPATSDLVFLPSLTEIDLVLQTYEERKARPTASVRDQLNDPANPAFVAWWLRTNGDFIGEIMVVRPDGTVNQNGQYGGDSVGVRPAIWLTGW